MSCPRCETPLEAGDLRCAVCALPVPISDDGPAVARAEILRCTECGAAVAFDASRGSPACVFCGAAMAIEHPADPIEVASKRLPFTVDRVAAATALRGWLGNRGWFAPDALRDEATIDSVHPLCWAAWIVGATAQVAWTADSDAGAGRSAWAPQAGVESIAFDDIVVSASRGISTREHAALVPHYDLATAVPVGDAGVPAESFDVQRSAARRQVHAAIDAIARTQVKRAIPGRRYRNVRVSCLLQRQTTERVALPAWVMSYRFRGAPYRAIVHGQRPDVVVGSAPTDWRKVMWVALTAALVLAAILVIVLRA
ncbi:MAG TPA: hypothetical protein VGL61_29220 [Kofleriaceae bacterium]|jgi:hypothetical protein